VRARPGPARGYFDRSVTCCHLPKVEPSGICRPLRRRALSAPNCIVISDATAGRDPVRVRDRHAAARNAGRRRRPHQRRRHTEPGRCTPPSRHSGGAIGPYRQAGGGAGGRGVRPTPYQDHSAGSVGPERAGEPARLRYDQPAARGPPVAPSGQGGSPRRGNAAARREARPAAARRDAVRAVHLVLAAFWPCGGERAAPRALARHPRLASGVGRGAAAARPVGARVCGRLARWWRAPTAKTAQGPRPLGAV